MGLSGKSSQKAKAIVEAARQDEDWTVEAKQWWLGDWWNAGVAWGEGKKACEATGIAYQTAIHCGSGATPSVRRRR